MNDSFEMNKDENVTNKEIIKSCQGLENGNPRCAELSMILNFTGKTKEDMSKEEMYEEINSRNIRNAEIKISPRKSIVQIDFKFKTALDPELRLFWNQLEEYGDLITDSMDSDKQPVCLINFMPDRYIGRFVLTAINPIYWTLQPEVVGIDTLNIIRVIFPALNFEISEFEEDDVDFKKIESEVQRTLMTERKVN